MFQFTLADLLQSARRSARHAPPPAPNGHPLSFTAWGEVFAARTPDDWSDAGAVTDPREVGPTIQSGGAPGLLRILSPEAVDRLIERRAGRSPEELSPFFLALGEAAGRWLRSQDGVDAVFSQLTSRTAESLR